MKKVKKYLITYTNSKHKAHSVTVSTLEAVDSWTDRLDDRISRGTCGGYLVTEFTTWEAEQ